MKPKIFILLPSYNCECTLGRTFARIPDSLKEQIIFVDDASQDSSVEIAKELKIPYICVLNKNKGYGANQKTGYDKAIELGADYIIMLHPDNQYDPSLVLDIIKKFNEGNEVVFVSRFKNNKYALKNGMPLYKLLCNRALTFFQNMMCNQKLSEYHTGYRGYSVKLLQQLPYHSYSDDFIFDNEIILDIFKRGIQIKEIFGPGMYTDESSSINLIRSIKYGLLIIKNTILFQIQK